jgi:hypothetical protein
MSNSRNYGPTICLARMPHCRSSIRRRRLSHSTRRRRVSLFHQSATAAQLDNDEVQSRASLIRPARLTDERTNARVVLT